MKYISNFRSEESMERLIQTVSRDEERYKDKIQ